MSKWLFNFILYICVKITHSWDIISTSYNIGDGSVIGFNSESNIGYIFGGDQLGSAVVSINFTKSPDNLEFKRPGIYGPNQFICYSQCYQQINEYLYFYQNAGNLYKFNVKSMDFIKISQNEYHNTNYNDACIAIDPITQYIYIRVYYNFDVYTGDRWYKMDSLILPKIHFPCLLYDNTIYTFGGLWHNTKKDKWNESILIEMLNISNFSMITSVWNEWEYSDVELIYSVFSSRIVFIQETKDVYVIGGGTYEGTQLYSVATIQKVNFETNSSVFAGNINDTAYLHAVLFNHIDRRIYIFDENAQQTGSNYQYSKPIYTDSPTINPTQFSTETTSEPTKNTQYPSETPTNHPSKLSISPTHSPTDSPIINPTTSPTKVSANPTISPSNSPTNGPSLTPSKNPTFLPTKYPTEYESETPTQSPSNIPTHPPSQTPTETPTGSPIIPAFIMGSNDNRAQSPWITNIIMWLVTTVICVIVFFIFIMCIKFNKSYKKAIAMLDSVNITPTSMIPESTNIDSNATNNTTDNPLSETINENNTNDDINDDDIILDRHSQIEYITQGNANEAINEKRATYQVNAVKKISYYMGNDSPVPEDIFSASKTKGKQTNDPQ